MQIFLNQQDVRYGFVNCHAVRLRVGGLTRRQQPAPATNGDLSPGSTACASGLTLNPYCSDPPTCIMVLRLQVSCNHTAHKTVLTPHLYHDLAPSRSTPPRCPPYCSEPICIYIYIYIYMYVYIYIYICVCVCVCKTISNYVTCIMVLRLQVRYLLPTTPATTGDVLPGSAACASG